MFGDLNNLDNVQRTLKLDTCHLGVYLANWEMVYLCPLHLEFLLERATVTDYSIGSRGSIRHVDMDLVPVVR